MEWYIYFFVYSIYLGSIGGIYLYESKKYKKNIPYTSPKKKNNLFYRLSLGLLAGVHYSHFVGTYNHKKYNTQVFFPTTLECNIGGSLAGIILFILYPFLSLYLSQLVGLFGFLILLVPIVLNLISIFLDIKRHTLPAN